MSEKTISASERQELARIAEKGPADARVRAKAVLAFLNGDSQPVAAVKLGVHPQTVQRWLRRFRAGGARSLITATRGTSIALSFGARQALVNRMGESKAPREKLRLEGVLARSTGETIKSIAARLQVADMTVVEWLRAYKKHGLDGLVETMARYKQPKWSLAAIDKAIASSSGSEKVELEILKARTSGESLASIGQRLNLSRQRVHQRLKRYLKPVS
ncbi:MAG: helix-turn-helix domain-containing protein [Rudaea sp.]|uniref:helix-turn-helix domain-containing protein n=1 Tax=unclassified Rudaea TaxID=2627037 RepID=UPI0010FA6128|nr:MULTISPECIES: helix-turn-helix domain-containing protein [unclassified Rudaea]MBN8884458.1 helix-turn-helix domain-containing protein [Rudaea sp.]